MDLIEVEWLDACSKVEHIPVDEAKKIVPIRRKNAGYIIEEDKGSILICYGTLENLYEGELATEHAMRITKSMITKITRK